MTMYTIHKFSKVRFEGAPYNAMMVDETEWFSPDINLLIDKCIDLAKAAADDQYLLGYGRLTDSFNVDHGIYPGMELYKTGDAEYTMAWLVVPVIESVAKDYDRPLSI